MFFMSVEDLAGGIVDATLKPVPRFFQEQELAFMMPNFLERTSWRLFNEIASEVCPITNQRQASALFQSTMPHFSKLVTCLRVKFK